MVLKTVNGRQSSTVIPKSLETDKVSPMNLPALKEYPRHCAGTRKLGSALWLLWVEEMELESMGTKVAWMCGLGYQIAESYMEKQSQRCRGSPQVQSTLVAGSYRRLGKEPLERIRGNRDWNSHQRMEPVSTHWTRKLHDLPGLGTWDSHSTESCS